MAVALLEVLRCPVCGGALSDETDSELACERCLRRYAVQEGIPRLLDDALPGIAAKRAEIAGWVEKAQGESWYEPDDTVDAVLPYVCRDLGWDDSNWRANEQSFSVFLDRYVEPGMRVLEAGAAKCWGAQHVITRGCEYVATDILADPNIGLGRGTFYESRVGSFPRIQADAEYLPFADASFDVAYCVATLHHALDLPRMVRELARVTRPGGVVAGLNEGTRALGRSGDAPGQQGEKELGINEHVHTVWAYVAAFARAGLRIRRIEHAECWPRTRAGRTVSRVPKVGTTVVTLAEQSFGGYSGISIYARKP
ncbi:MAG TPA: methyltransferase domain-containing protein [Gaiellaceae bacterium]|nr:methyltransferase domain-containing protein [Gaiellaceae bacterium]